MRTEFSGQLIFHPVTAHGRNVSEVEEITFRLVASMRSLHFAGLGVCRKRALALVRPKLNT